MGNLSNSLKRFLGNKNTVTLLGIIIGVLVILVGYTWRVRQAIDPQTIPVAKEELKGNTLITQEHVGRIEVSKTMVDNTPNLVTNQSQVIGKYVAYDSKIPKGGLFYTTELMAPEQRPNYITEDIERGYTVFSLPVNMHTTYGNSIMPDDYIDLFISTTNEDGKVIVAEIIESIKVKDVRDEEGKSVNSKLSESGIPAELIFAVPDDVFLLLYRASKIGGMSIFPVPRNKAYTEDGDQRVNLVAKESLIELINSRSDLTYSG